MAHRAVIFAVAQLSCTHLQQVSGYYYRYRQARSQTRLVHVHVCGLVLQRNQSINLHLFHRAMHYSACRRSVCNVGGSGSHMLEILETNCTDN